MITLAAEFLRISYLLFFYKVLEDLQETLEIEIRGAEKISEAVESDEDNKSKVNDTEDTGIQ